MTVGEKVIRLPVRFDFSVHRVFTEQYEQALQKCEQGCIEVDFSLVQYLDSSALGMLVLLHKQATQKGIVVHLNGCQGTVLEILTMANMQKLFQIN